MSPSAVDAFVLPSLPEKDLPKLGEIIGDKYRVDGMLGSGGMSAVFKVTHCVTKKSFALKWMLPSLSQEPDAVQRFIREAQVAGRFEHPNVVEVYDFGRQADSLYMVMEFLQGENLASRISGGPLTAEQACAILLPTARAVAVAHAAGVIHRDLKPQNIFLTRSPDGDLVPKVLDFGISKMTQLPGELKPAITAEGTVIGTPHYMAPEQICGQPIDERIDVYALGVMLYEALTGEVPFPCTSYGDLILRITTQSPKSIRSLAPNTPLVLVEIVSRAMHRERSCRYGSMSELADALEHFATSFGYTSALPYTATKSTGATPWPRTPLSSESGYVTAVRNRAMKRKVLRKYGVEFAVVFTLIAVGIALRSHLSVDSAAAPAEAPGPTGATINSMPEESVKPSASLLASPEPQTLDAGLAQTEPVKEAEPTPTPAPQTQTQTQIPRRLTTPNPTPARRISPTPSANVLAPPPTLASQPATAAPRASTRRTHSLSDADF